jgi:putative membrane protein
MGMIRIFGYLIANVAVLLLMNLFPDVSVQFLPAIIFVVFLTLLNWTIVPLIKLLALPINFLTFGLFNGLINLVVLLIMMNVIKGIDINVGFGQQVLYALLITVGFGIAQGAVNRLTDDE